MRIARRATRTAVAGAVAFALVACGSGDEENGGTGGGDGGDASEDDFRTSLTFGTGGSAGVYFPLGTEYANLFEEHIDGLSVNAIETGASVDNLGRIAQGEMQVGLSQNNTAIEAAAGTGDFEGIAVENIGWAGQLYPEAAQVITLESSGFESIEDLAGKRISIGPPGSGTRAVAVEILSAHGIEDGDYQPFEESFADARSKLQDGNLDASIEILGVPAASLGELAATQEVRLLPIDPEVASEIAGGSDFEDYTIPSSAYDFIDTDVSTVAVFAGVVLSTTQVSPDVGYDITRVLYEHAGDISLAQGDLIDIDDALLGRGDLSLHPGAERYFQEQGLL